MDVVSTGEIALCKVKWEDNYECGTRKDFEEYSR
jgi:hypothetical protein